MSDEIEQFTSRWGNAVADDHHYCHVPGYILRNYHKCVSEIDVIENGKLVVKRGQVCDIGMIDIMFVIHIMAFKYDASGGQASPSLETIAEYAGVHATSVRRIKKRLMQYGLMTVKPQPGRPDVYEFKGLHNQCLRLEEGKTPIEGIDVTPSKSASGSKNARGWARKNARGVVANLLGEESKEESESKKDSSAPEKTGADSREGIPQTSKKRKRVTEAAGKEKTPPTSAPPPKRGRAPDPMFDAVTSYIFGIDDAAELKEMNKSDAIGMRINYVARWLNGEIDRYRKGQAKTDTIVGFISRPAETIHVKAFADWWKRGHPTGDCPRELDTFVLRWREWASKQNKAKIIQMQQPARSYERPILTPEEQEAARREREEMKKQMFGGGGS